MQNLAALLTALLLLILSLVFWWVLSSTDKLASLEDVAPPAYRARGKLFVFALLAGVAVTGLTLLPWPHDAQATQVNRTIDVKARQWAWELSSNQAQVGEVVEFRVSSVDVNHGFALYDQQGAIVAQIQAMPGFVNKVRHHFQAAGKYQVLCLEYCGVAHHGMVAEIQVDPKP